MAEEVPNFLQRLSSDEYTPAPYTERDHKVISGSRETLRSARERYRLRSDQWRLASTTAAGLLALNSEYGADFYRVPPEAVIDPDAAAAAFHGDGLVIDVQTHFIAPRCAKSTMLDSIFNCYKSIMPSWWSEMGDLTRYTLEDYVRNIFLETEVSIAILTSNPGVDDKRMLFNEEIATTRALINGFAGSGRLLSHAVVHADLPEEIAAMPDWISRFSPAAWKVYTPGRSGPLGWTAGWMLDDEIHGIPFLERVQALGPKRVCVHKGISSLADNGSPRDIGPAAKAFPDIQFLVYHSGYEFPHDGAPPEGPYSEATAGHGINRLIHSCLEAGIPRGGNVYAELGTTWFSLVRRPAEAAHVLGKLIKHFGADNVIWGSDSIWYGSQQPLIDAFRSIQIPDWMCEQFGYDKLTPQVRDKILGGNAAQVYGVDLSAVRKEIANDDLKWGKLLLEELQRESASID